MGTRADFYIGEEEKAEWLGSVGRDGYEWAEEENTELMMAKTLSEYKQAVKSILHTREDATRPKQGWPWPWDDSQTTDYVYWWNGEKTKFDTFSKKKWPDMTNQKEVTL